jgi:putative FmdB family regulatory protein
MPTYDYECRRGHRFEIVQKMSDEPVAQCPECGAEATRKISGGAGFLFKGEGFYITDYRSEEYRKKASAETGDAPAAKPDKSEGGSAKRGSGSANGDSGSKKRGGAGSPKGDPGSSKGGGSEASPGSKDA